MGYASPPPLPRPRTTFGAWVTGVWGNGVASKNHLVPARAPGKRSYHHQYLAGKRAATGRRDLEGQMTLLPRLRGSDSTLCTEQ